MSNATITFPLLGEDFALNFKRYFTLFGRNFYWYGVAIAVGFLLAAIYMLARCKKFNLTDDNVIDMLLCAIIPGVIGARLYYVLFEFETFKDTNFLGTLRNIVSIWNGGLAIYGGIIFGLLGLFLYAKVKRLPVGRVFDLSAFGVMIGQIVGRWGNFINREAYGDVTELPWKMGLTSGSTTIYVHPTFLYESLWNLIGLVILHFISKKNRKYDGRMFLMYVAWYGFGRFFIEMLRQDSLYIGGTGIRVSCVVAAASCILAVILLIVNRKNCSLAEAEETVEETEEAAETEEDVAEEAQEEDLPEEADSYEDDSFDDDFEDAFSDDFEDDFDEDNEE